MITEEELGRTLDWLVKAAIPASKARAEREYVEQFRKSLKAILMGKSDAKTIAEREAYASAIPSTSSTWTRLERLSRLTRSTAGYR